MKLIHSLILNVVQHLQHGVSFCSHKGLAHVESVNNFLVNSLFDGSELSLQMEECKRNEHNEAAISHYAKHIRLEISD